MKKDFNTKKKITIAALSVVAVCLIGGLFYYIGGMNTESPVKEDKEVVGQVEDTIVVPKIDDAIIVDPSEDMKTDETVEDEKVEEPTDDTTIETNPLPNEREDGKPQTKDEAVPPTDNTPPVVDDKGEEEQKVVEPNKPAIDTPTSGDVNESGAVYVPGLGWIEDSGEPNTVITAPNAGTGDVIGEMN